MTMFEHQQTHVCHHAMTRRNRSTNRPELAYACGGDTSKDWAEGGTTSVNCPGCLEALGMASRFPAALIAALQETLP